MESPIKEEYSNFMELLQQEVGKTISATVRIKHAPVTFNIKLKGYLIEEENEQYILISSSENFENLTIQKAPKGLHRLRIGSTLNVFQLEYEEFVIIVRF